MYSAGIKNQEVNPEAGCADVPDEHSHLIVTMLFVVLSSSIKSIVLERNICERFLYLEPVLGVSVL